LIFNEALVEESGGQSQGDFIHCVRLLSFLACLHRRLAVLC
jgi:hypothetical protein